MAAMEQVSFAHDESTTTTPEKNMNSQQEIQEKVEKERELEEFEKHPDLVGLACKVIVGTMTQTLSQRMTRLTDQIEIDQKHLQAVYATLGVSPDGNGALSPEGVEAMSNPTTCAEIKAVLEGLVKAIERHREEAASITEDTAFLNSMTKKVIELEELGKVDGSDLEATLDKLTM